MKIILLQQDVCWIINISKNHFRFIAVDLSLQKELDLDSKAIQQIELLYN